MNIVYILLAILLLGIMVLVHEAGHFFASRIAGIPVKGFGIGFGPKIWSRKSKKSETEYALRLIPAGGYCSYYGEDDPSATDQDPRSFRKQKAWKRLFAVLMGPIMNFVLAFIVCVIFLLCIGSIARVDYTQPLRIMKVTENGAAEKAGIIADDRVLTVNGENALGLSENGNTRMSELISQARDMQMPITFGILRGEEEISIDVTPYAVLQDDGTTKLMVGIEYRPEYEIIHLDTPGKLFSESWSYMIDTAGSILEGFGTLFSSWKNLTTMGSGPVGIVSTVAEQTQTYGIEAYIQLLILISVNLGIVNLLPIPGLDGSRAIFLLIEIIFRKPVNPKVEAWIHLIGFVFLFALILFFTMNDIIRIF